MEIEHLSVEEMKVRYLGEGWTDIARCVSTSEATEQAQENGYEQANRSAPEQTRTNQVYGIANLRITRNRSVRREASLVPRLAYSATAAWTLTLAGEFTTRPAKSYANDPEFREKLKVAASDSLTICVERL